MSMARKKNSGDGGTKGFAEADGQFQPPGPIYPDPGPRDLKDPTWVQRDRQFKESLPQTKYY
jgi:hypothetical protein